jgi:hypothetical protein
MARKLKASSASSGRGRSKGASSSGSGATPAPQTVFTDGEQQIRDQSHRETLQRISDKKRQLETVRGEYRAMLKSAKANGLEPADITWYLATKKRDVADVDREIARRNRIARLMGLPIGSQLGLLGEEFDKPGRSVADQVGRDQIETNSALAISRRNECRQQGMRAHEKNQAKDTNPYADGSPDFLAWSSGWQEKQDAVAKAAGEALGGKPANGNDQTKPPSKLDLELAATHGRMCRGEGKSRDEAIADRYHDQPALQQACQAGWDERDRELASPSAAQSRRRARTQEAPVTH